MRKCFGTTPLCDFAFSLCFPPPCHLEKTPPTGTDLAVTLMVRSLIMLGFSLATIGSLILNPHGIQQTFSQLHPVSAHQRLISTHTSHQTFSLRLMAPFLSKIPTRDCTMAMIMPWKLQTTANHLLHRSPPPQYRVDPRFMNETQEVPLPPPEVRIPKTTRRVRPNAETGFGGLHRADLLFELKLRHNLISRV